MEPGDRNADLRSDLEIITNSMHMLPPWVPAAGRGGPAWWSRFEEFAHSYPPQRLAEYLAEIMEVLDPDVRAPRHRIRAGGGEVAIGADPVQHSRPERIERDRIAAFPVAAGFLDYDRLAALASQLRRQGEAADPAADDQHAHSYQPGPASAMTTRTSSIRSSSVPAGARSDRPMARLPNQARRVASAWRRMPSRGD
jgi:hypothetical protein